MAMATNFKLAWLVSKTHVYDECINGMLHQALVHGIAYIGAGHDIFYQPIYHVFKNLINIDIGALVIFT